MIDATFLLARYAARRRIRLDAQDPRATQERELMRLLRRAADTRFGREHGLATVDGVAAFQDRVALNSYQTLDDAYWRALYPRVRNATWPGRVPYFAVTSGTSSGVTKLIPVTWEMVAANRRAALDVLVHHLAARPDSRVFGGRTLMLGGSTALIREEGGARRGDLSGIAAREVPWWARPFAFPPPSVALMTDWDRKTDVMAETSLAHDIRALSGTANWLRLFLDKVAARAGHGSDVRLAKIYPQLELVVHGGMDFRPYRAYFQQATAGSRIDLREVYAASEGFIAIADRTYGEGMRLILDNGLFFEFGPVGEMSAERPIRHWVGTIETGIDYVVVLSSCAGLWAYVLGDIVRFVDTTCPRLLITGRTSYRLSAFGEHLSGEQIDDAIREAALAEGVAFVDYAVGALFPGPGQPAGRHLMIVEFSGPAADPGRFAAAVDRRLQRANLDYHDLRAGDCGLLAPVLLAVPPGAFTDWMRRRGRLGGQNKVPRVIADAALFDDLHRFCVAQVKNNESPPWRPVS
jgi:hypothetical protein